MTSSSHEIFALRREGRTGQALEQARAAYAGGARDVWFLRAYAWTLFDQVNRDVERHAQNELSPAAMSSQVSDTLREFCRFGGPLRQDPAFSQMVRLAVKVSQDWKDFLAFARWAGLACFSEEDKKPFAAEGGREVASLEKRFIRAVCREAVARAGDAGRTACSVTPWGESVLDDALRQDPNDPLLNYYRSKLHLLRNETPEAIDRLLPVIRRHPKAAWPWALLGPILEQGSPPDAITCLAYATQLARQEQEVAKTRLHLARLLAAAGRFLEAGWEIGRSLDYRAQNGFRHPPALVQLRGAAWYQEGLQAQSFQAVPDAAAGAQALVLGLDRQRLVYRLGVVDHVNADKQLTFVATGADSGWVLLHGRFPGSADLHPGAVVELGFGQDQAFPLHWRPSPATEIAGLCEVLEGELDRCEGQAFAFIRTARGDVFVAPGVLPGGGGAPPGTLRCQAIWRTRGKTGKASWRALKLVEKA